MHDSITAIFIVGIIFSSIAFVIKTISDNRLRNRLVDKGELGENVQYLFTRKPTGNMQSLGSVKWGLVLIAVGLALFVGKLFPYHIYEETTFGLMLLFAGIALLIYYYIYKRAERSADIGSE